MSRGQNSAALALLLKFSMYDECVSHQGDHRDPLIDSDDDIFPFFVDISCVTGLHPESSGETLNELFPSLRPFAMVADNAHWITGGSWRILTCVGWDGKGADGV